MTFTRFLAELRIRGGTHVPDDFDPIGLILARVSVNPHTTESKALRKATLAVISGEGEMTDADLGGLGKHARGLLDAFPVERLTARYRTADLTMIADKLRGVTA